MPETETEADTTAERFFAVQPKLDCPHVCDACDFILPEAFSLRQCSQCHHEPENWLCLGCGAVFCSRYVNSHMLEHFTGLYTLGRCKRAAMLLTVAGRC